MESLATVGDANLGQINGPGWYKKASQTIHGEKVKCSSVAFAQDRPHVPALLEFLPWLPSVLEAVMEM